jgi:hypothetical protein
MINKEEFEMKVVSLLAVLAAVAQSDDVQVRVEGAALIAQGLGLIRDGVYDD